MVIIANPCSFFFRVCAWVLTFGALYTKALDFFQLMVYNMCYSYVTTVTLSYF